MTTTAAFGFWLTPMAGKAHSEGLLHRLKSQIDAAF